MLRVGYVQLIAIAVLVGVSVTLRFFTATQTTGEEIKK
jgi:hypothetical protein